MHITTDNLHDKCDARVEFVEEFKANARGVAEQYGLDPSVIDSTFTDAEQADFEARR